MSTPRRGLVAGPVRRVAAASWQFRWRVELEAAARFELLAERLAAMGGAPRVVELALRSAQDEQRHAVLCAERARAYGSEQEEHPVVAVREYAPAGLLPRGKLLYELVAACCITETESMGVLTTLLGAVRDGHLRSVLRQLASDEVRHSQLGWAHLASEHRLGATAFLSPLVPAMLQGSAAPDLFSPVGPELEDEQLLGQGVLPHALKREVFTRTLVEVIFPGLESFGVDPAPARAWLAAKLSSNSRLPSGPSGA